tara:strand:- start:23 stop:391 length:369 start_codon:yes stop_codon:yes gene_type:complete
MKIFKFLLLQFFLACFVSSCAVVEEIITPGEYAVADSREFIFINGNTIKFHLYDKKNSVFFEKEYKYSLLADGKIQPYPMTSVDAIYGIGKFDWYLKEGDIHMKDPKTKKMSVFEFKGDASL